MCKDLRKDSVDRGNIKPKGENEGGDQCGSSRSNTQERERGRVVGKEAAESSHVI